MIKHAVIFMTLLVSLSLAGQGQPLEDFNLWDVNNKKSTLYGLLEKLPADGVLIMNFTSVTCKPCKLEIPELLAVEQSSGGRALLVCVYAECCDPVKESASSLGVLEKSYSDPFGKIRNKFDAKSFPVTYLIDRQYMVIGRYEGYTKENIEAIKKIVGR